MKKMVYFVIAVCMVISISASAFADDEFTIKLREWFPGIKIGDMTVGALASGNIFNSDGENVGYVNIAWSHNGEGIEVCNAVTELISIRIVMNFYDGGRLVLAGPSDGPVYANWDFDDSNHPNGNIILIGYSNFLDPDINLNESIVACDYNGDDIDAYNNPDAAYIAEVPSFQVVRQRFGSYGFYGRSFSGGDLYGILDHRPFLSPAVVGKIILHE